LARTLKIRRAFAVDAPAVNNLLSEWFDWTPASGRLGSIERAIRNRELLVAEDRDRIIGFLHYVIHEDIIDGGLNTFITAFYVSPRYRRKGIGSRLLERAIDDSLKKGVVGVETSTIHRLAKKLYERHHFKQTVGDIGEVFLELDIPEYIKAEKSRHS
jgi:GNAT superfamily N-acetyltransferase